MSAPQSLFRAPQGAPRPGPWRVLRAGLGLAVLLAVVGPAEAQGSKAALAAARSAIAEDRVGRTKVLGCYDEKRPFSELYPDGALLTGFDLGVGRAGDIETVYALRPIYWTRVGDAAGADHGLFRNRRGPGKKVIKSKVVRMVRIQARPGYAVGAVTVRSGLNINGLAVTFMRINGATLDPARSYSSEWVGDRTGGGENTITGSGAPVVGVFGSNDEEHVQAFGLYFIKPPPTEAAAPAEPQRTAAANQRPAPPTVERPAAPLRARRPPTAAPVPPAVKAVLQDPPAAPADEPIVEDHAAPAAAPPLGEANAEALAEARVANGSQKELPPLPDPLSWLPYVLGGALVVPLFAVTLASVGRRRPASQTTGSQDVKELDVIEEVEAPGQAANGAGTPQPAPEAIANTRRPRPGPKTPAFLPPSLAPGAPVDVSLPTAPPAGADRAGRWPVSAWVGTGAAVAVGSAAVLLLAPPLFPAIEEHLFLMEKVLFSTVLSAVGGFAGWALAGRLEAEPS